jgi:hypothetical protein
MRFSGTRHARGHLKTRRTRGLGVVAAALLLATAGCRAGDGSAAKPPAPPKPHYWVEHTETGDLYLSTLTDAAEIAGYASTDGAFKHYTGKHNSDGTWSAFAYDGLTLTIKDDTMVAVAQAGTFHFEPISAATWHKAGGPNQDGTYPTVGPGSGTLRDSDRDEVLKVANAAVPKMLSVDYANRAAATSAAAPYVTNQMADQLGQTMSRVQASSIARIRTTVPDSAAGIISVTDPTDQDTPASVDVLAFANQVTTGAGPRKVTQSRLRVTLVRDGSTWKVDALIPDHFTPTARDDNETYAEVQDAAVKVTEAFMTLDYRDIGSSIKRVLALTDPTGEFEQDYRDSAADLRSSAISAHAVSSGKVLSVGVEWLDDDEAAVEVAADSHVRNDSTGAKTEPRYYRMTETLKFTSGAWRLESLEFVS